MDVNDDEFGPGRANRPTDAEYERLCAHIVRFMEREKGWLPYRGTGVSVMVPLKVGSVRLDIGLLSPDGSRILVGECRGHSRRLAQAHVIELKGKMDMVAEATGKQVEAILFSSGGFQRGLVAVASPYRIRLAHVAKGQNPDGFTISFAEYDQSTAKPVISGRGMGAGESLTCTDAVQVELLPPRE